MTGGEIAVVVIVGVLAAVYLWLAFLFCFKWKR